MEQQKNNNTIPNRFRVSISTGKINVRYHKGISNVIATCCLALILK